METILDELIWRNIIQDITPELHNNIQSKSLTLYSGFDPTANSLHVGNLVPILGLVRFQRAGHKPIALIGGGTGFIGDPSGKKNERQLLEVDQINSNAEAMGNILSHYLDFKGNFAARMVNNLDWLKDISILNFLRDTGKHFSINSMLGRDAIKIRLETGISFTEFSYLLLQARDYLELYDRYDCNLQIGGSDQWGNIIAGIDLIRRVRSQSVHGLSMPLITKADGTKFGKTEQGSIWLTEDKTSAYEFYQFWFNTDDRDVIQYLKCFTFLTQNEIAEVEENFKQVPEERAAQKKLASEVTTFIHGLTATSQSLQASQILFGEEIKNISEKMLLEIFSNTPSTEINFDRFTEKRIGIVDLVTAAGLATSKSDARRTIEGGGIYFNNVRISSPQEQISIEQFIDGNYGVLRKGAKKYHLVKICQ